MIDFDPLSSYNDFELMAKSLLLVNPSELPFLDPAFVEKFNQDIDALFSNSDLIEPLSTLFDISNDAQAVLRLVSFIVSKLTTENPFINLKMVSDYLDEYEKDARAGVIFGIYLF
jgi:hypothetical protein